MATLCELMRAMWIKEQGVNAAAGVRAEFRLTPAEFDRLQAELDVVHHVPAGAERALRRYVTFMGWIVRADVNVPPGEIRVVREAALA